MDLDRPLRFHWSLSQAGNPFRRAEDVKAMSGLPDFAAQRALCLRAEECGIESMLMAIGFTRPDPLLLSLALGREARRIGFMIACRPSLVAPALFVQQLDTARRLLDGRVSINIVSGHRPEELAYYGCFEGHDGRYRRTEGFLEACHALWGDPRDEPEIYLGGNSPEALALAARQADCLFRFAEAPQALRPHVDAVVAAGKEVGLLVALIGAPSRDEAVARGEALAARFGEAARAVHREFERKSDSVAFTATYRLAREHSSGWVTESLWAGLVDSLGPPAIALVGSPDDIARAILDYKQVGVSQFLFLGWPDLEEMTFFGREILPRIRELEREAARPTLREGGGRCG